MRAVQRLQVEFVDAHVKAFGGYNGYYWKDWQDLKEGRQAFVDNMRIDQMEARNNGENVGVGNLGMGQSNNMGFGMGQSDSRGQSNNMGFGMNQSDTVNQSDSFLIQQADSVEQNFLDQKKKADEDFQEMEKSKFMWLLLNQCQQMQNEVQQTSERIRKMHMQENNKHIQENNKPIKGANTMQIEELCPPPPAIIELLTYTQLGINEIRRMVQEEEIEGTESTRNDVCEIFREKVIGRNTSGKNSGTNSNTGGTNSNTGKITDSTTDINTSLKATYNNNIVNLRTRALLPSPGMNSLTDQQKKALTGGITDMVQKILEAVLLIDSKRSGGRELEACTNLLNRMQTEFVDAIVDVFGGYEGCFWRSWEKLKEFQKFGEERNSL